MQFVKACRDSNTAFYRLPTVQKSVGSVVRVFSSRGKGAEGVEV